MSMDAEYNGYANRPTWTVSLWLENDYGLYTYTREMLAEEPEERRGEILKEYVEELCMGEEPLASMATDLLTWVLAWVEWDEVVKSLMAE